LTTMTTCLTIPSFVGFYPMYGGDVRVSRRAGRIDEHAFASVT
jgi:hypothetical protein